MASSSLTSLLPILLIVAIAAIGIPIYLKKKKGKTANIAISQHKNKDEVWKAVKQFLKDNGENGKEIIDCYVAKRNAIDFVNPNLPKWIKVRKRDEIKIRKWQFEQQKKAMKTQGKKLVHPKEKDLYIVCFTTKETRTDKIDRPRCIECEVTNTRINKKNWDRKILIHGEADYDKEMEWIAPLKFAEKIKNERAVKQQEKTEAKKQKQLLKRKQKTKAKLDKIKLKKEVQKGV